MSPGSAPDRGTCVLGAPDALANDRPIPGGLDVDGAGYGEACEEGGGIDAGGGGNVEIKRGAVETCGRGGGGGTDAGAGGAAEAASFAGVCDAYACGTGRIGSGGSGVVRGTGGAEKLRGKPEGGGGGGGIDACLSEGGDVEAPGGVVRNDERGGGGGDGVWGLREPDKLEGLSSCNGPRSPNARFGSGVAASSEKARLDDPRGAADVFPLVGAFGVVTSSTLPNFPRCVRPPCYSLVATIATAATPCSDDLHAPFGGLPVRAFLFH